MHPFMYRLLCNTCFAPPDNPPSPPAAPKPGEAGYIAPVDPDDDDDDNEPAGLTPEAKKEFDKIRRRMSKYRLEKKELDGRLEAETTERAKAIKDAETRVRADADVRVIKSEVRAALKAAGAVDVGDAMKLLDIAGIKIGDNGEVEGVDALITAAKTGKAYLFKAVTTSHDGNPPKARDPAAKHARDMTPAEFQAGIDKLTAPRR